MDNKQTGGRVGFFDGVKKSLGEQMTKRKEERGALAFDILSFMLALFFARRHLAFGAYPLAGALLAVLPSRVWISLCGAALGSLMMGRAGLLFLVNAVVTVFLRIVISGGKRDEELFREPYVMRIAAGTFGALITSLYNIMIRGISLSSVMFAVFSILFTVALDVSLYGLFAYGATLSDVFFGERSILFCKAAEKNRWGRAAFECGAAVMLFLIAFSLSEYVYFGISLSYIFCGVATLFIARRFGAVRGMACGFFSALAVAPLGAVAFALSGLGAGALFGVGYGYAVVGGGILLSVWCAYAGGVGAFLSVFAEYNIAAALAYPFLRNSKSENKDGTSKNSDASEMVFAMAESMREGAASKRLDEAITLASFAIKDYGEDDMRGEFEEYRNIVIVATAGIEPAPCEENIDILAAKLYKKQKISGSEAKRLIGACDGGALISEIYRLEEEYERTSYEKRRMDAVSGEYELIGKMISEAEKKRRGDLSQNNTLTRALSGVMGEVGLPHGIIRAYGEGRVRVIGAAEDKEGVRISSPDLKRRIEGVIGARLGKFEFFRKGDTALFVSSATPKFKVEYATAAAPSPRSEISGDTATFFEEDGVFYSLISDGMGSGRVAERTSKFVSRFLSRLIPAGVNINSAISAVNHLIRHRGEECSATVDLFSLDLVTGAAQFTKCGSPPAIVKRGDTLFRVKSATAPIGLMKDVDSERIKADVRDGDYIIMLSDGASVLPDEAVWLFELLSAPQEGSLEDYANEILSAARKNSGADDDITVSVIKISSVA